MKKQVKGRRSLIASFVASALASAAAAPSVTWAQEAGATLQGRADANAEVTAKNVDTGLTRKTERWPSLRSVPPNSLKYMRLSELSSESGIGST